MTKLEWYFNNLKNIYLFYLLCIFFLAIALYFKITYMTFFILLVMSVLLIGESIFVLQNIYHQHRFLNISKLILVPGKFVFFGMITIWAIGDANQFVHLVTQDDPNNYSTAVQSLTIFYTITNSLMLISVLYSLLLFLLAISGKWLFLRIGRAIAWIIITGGFFLNYNGAVTSICNKILVHTAFYTNYECYNPLIMGLPMAHTSNDEKIIVYIESNNTFQRNVDCDLVHALITQKQQQNEKK